MASPKNIADSFQKAMNLSGSPSNAVSTSPTQSYLNNYVPNSQKPTKA